MKNSIKIFLLIFVFFLLYSSIIYSQEPIGEGEFMIINKSSNSINVSIYPSGAIFNGIYEYNLFAVYPITGQEYIYPKGPNPIILEPFNNGTYFKRANFDKTSDNQQCHFSLGYGAYIIKINDNVNPEYFFYIDFSDANFCDISDPYYHKIKVKYYGYQDLKFNFCRSTGEDFNEVNINYFPETISVWEQKGTPNEPTPFTPNKGNFTDAQNTESFLHNWPINANEHNALGHESPQFIRLNTKLIYNDASMYVDENEQLTFWNCIFEISDNITFYVDGAPNWGSLLIKGPEAIFISGINSNIIFNNGNGIVIDYKALIDANYSYFKSQNPGTIWAGLTLSNEAGGNINNCSFINANYPIHASDNGNTKLNITNCSLYVKNYGSGIFGENINNIFISGNHIWQPNNDYLSSGIQILNTAYSENDNNLAPWDSNIKKIIGNHFYYGSSQLSVYGTSANLTNVYIENNYFEDGMTMMDFVNVVGTIYNNICTSSVPNNSSRMCIYLTQSSPNIKNNNITSNFRNFYIRNFSYPNLAPLLVENQLIWKGGINTLKSIDNQNIASDDEPGYFFTDFGKNSFLTNSNHFFGCLVDTTNIYYSRGNCWFLYDEPSEPHIYLYKHTAHGNEQIPVNWNDPYPDCYWANQIVDRMIQNLGDGIYDTILITQSNINSPPENDESLYAMGVVNQDMKLFSSAISNIKALINTYPNSKYIEKSIFNLYDCYLSSDTNHNQNWRNIVFSDLKNYLSDKIQQYENNDEFVNIAFEFYLKCLVKVKNYITAMDGYDFVATYSPYPIARFLASIDFIDVEGLIGGQGGSEKENNTNNSEIIKPIKEILLNAYSKTSKSIKKKEEQELKNAKDINKTKRSLIEKHNSDKVLKVRALDNIKIAGTLNRKQRQKKIRSELEFLRQRKINDFPIEEHKVVPIEYSLSQNYPNPFNPITNIKYSIKDQKLVTLKIYDILGREVKTLVNEIKTPGEYLVSFNGSELSSGIYFYRIIVGDFTAVKRMLMIK
jgi:hypothetical protein